MTVFHPTPDTGITIPTREEAMPRMYAEGKFPRSRSTRDIFAELMAQLDRQADAAGHRVRDDVEISEFESPLEVTRHIRIEAEVVPR